MQYMNLRKLDSEVVHMLRNGELSLSDAVILTGCSKTACFNARIGLTWKDHPTPPMPVHNMKISLRKRKKK